MKFRTPKQMKRWLHDSTGNETVHYLYTVYDQVANAYEPCVCVAAEPERMLLNMRRAAMEGRIIFPNDKTLILLGVFRDDTAALVPSDAFVVGSLAIPDLDRLKVRFPKKGEIDATEAN